MKQKDENILGWIIGGSLIALGVGLVVADQIAFRSKHFTFNDLVKTSKTTISEHPEQFNPSKTIKSNANYLVKKTLDPLYELSSFSITSWFRSVFVNNQVGGVDSSKHLTGEAADIVPNIMFKSFLEILEQSDIPFTKAINEGDHIHITLIKGRENERQIIE